ncbi:MAG: hypothetical protein RJA81_1028 [Planctomycetota bacterium]|jgi:hypothetical protein
MLEFGLNHGLMPQLKNTIADHSQTLVELYFISDFSSLPFCDTGDQVRDQWPNELSSKNGEAQ